MKPTILCLAITCFSLSITSVAAPLTSPHASTNQFASAVKQAWEIHGATPRHATYHELAATTYGGDDVSGKALPMLRAIA